MKNFMDFILTMFFFFWIQFRSKNYFKKSKKVSFFVIVKSQFVTAKSFFFSVNASLVGWKGGLSADESRRYHPHGGLRFWCLRRSRGGSCHTFQWWEKGQTQINSKRSWINKKKTRKSHPSILKLKDKGRRKNVAAENSFWRQQMVVNVDSQEEDKIKGW